MKRWTLLVVTAALAAATVAVVVPARALAAPGNDNFAAAQQLSGTAGGVSSTNQGATKEIGEPDHAGNTGGASVWFRWTAGRSGGLTVLTRHISFDTVLGVYTGASVDSLTEVASNDNFGSGLASRLSFAAIPGTTYYIAVDGAGGAQGPFSLRFRQGPENDAFADASLIEGAQGVVKGTVYGATSEFGEPLHGGGATVWYRWVAPADGKFALRLRNAQAITVSTGLSVDALAQIATAGSFLTFDATSGTEYRIAVEGKWSGGLFSLVWAPVPANDDFVNSQAIDGLKGRVHGTNRFASVEAGEPNIGCCRPSVWYAWTAPRTLDIRFETANINFDTILDVYRGASLDSLARFAHNDDFLGRASGVSIHAKEGVTYFIRVSPYLNQGEGVFDLKWFPGAIIIGSRHDDEITGTAGRDFIYGGGGDDVIHAGGGGDILDGGLGADRLYGGAGPDFLYSRDGVGGNDLIVGGPGTDTTRKDSGDHVVGVP
jgi:Ca2+-binding RTX toxin-like protein